MSSSSAWPGRSISVVSIAAPVVGSIRTIAVPDALMCIARRVPSGDPRAAGHREPLPPAVIGQAHAATVATHDVRMLTRAIDRRMRSTARQAPRGRCSAPAPLVSLESWPVGDASAQMSRLPRRLD